MIWRGLRREFSLARPLVMGIVNVTPDSFSDGGRDAGAAIAHGLALIDEGADLLDVGGESTRPGATPVDEAEELRRVVSVVAELSRQAVVPVSIDTMKPAVARACIEVGAEIINDVAGLRDPGMAEVVRETGAACIVMHMQGTPPTMQLDPQYTQVVAEVGEFFEERMSTLKQLGIPVERICLDPGIGFGKKSAHNWQLLAGLSEYQRLGRPVCLGVSRKGFLGKDRAPTERVPAGIAAALHGISKHAVHVIRTHDVRATRDAIDTWLAVEAAR